MGLHLFWIFQVVLFAALAAGAKPKYHFHSSDIRPQHSFKKQLDYKPIKRRTQEAEGINSTAVQPSSVDNSKGPVVMLAKSGMTVMLQELIVRIYQEEEYICVGTLISEKLVVTTSTCFRDDTPALLTMKTYTNEVILGKRTSLNQTFIKGDDPMLATIELETKMRDSKFKDDIVKLCDIKLHGQAEVVQVPLWIRRTHSLHNRKSWTMPVIECRHRMKDPEGIVATDAMICVRNERYTSTCQNAIGNPLVHNNMICGLNVAGHNCPVFSGVNLYTTIYDDVRFALGGLKLLNQLDIEKTVL